MRSPRHLLNNKQHDYPNNPSFSHVIFDNSADVNTTYYSCLKSILRDAIRYVG